MAGSTPVYLAISADIENVTGKCFKKKKIKQTSKEFYNMNIAKRLWDVSNEYCKEYTNWIK